MRHAGGLGTLTGIGGIILLVALLAPPNSWDSMTSHMARVSHWEANPSVDHYSTFVSTGSGRVSHYLVPGICLLAGLGIPRASSLFTHGTQRRHVQRAVLALLLVFGILLGVAVVVRPYRNRPDMANRDFARWFWDVMARDAELVCGWEDLQLEFARPPAQWAPGGADWRVNQRIYSERIHRRLPPNLANVSANHPLRVVFLGSALHGADDALDQWIDDMSRGYELASRKRHRLGAFKEQHGKEDWIEVFTFVPMVGGKGTPETGRGPPRLVVSGNRCRCRSQGLSTHFSLRLELQALPPACNCPTPVKGDWSGDRKAQPDGRSLWPLVELIAVGALLSIDLWLPGDRPVLTVLSRSMGVGVVVHAYLRTRHLAAPSKPPIGRPRGWFEAALLTAIVVLTLSIVEIALLPAEVPRADLLSVPFAALALWFMRRLYFATIQQLLLHLFFVPLWTELLNSRTLAVLSTAVLFGAFHPTSLWLALFAGLLSALWVLLYGRSRQLLPLILSHAIIFRVGHDPPPCALRRRR